MRAALCIAWILAALGLALSTAGAQVSASSIDDAQPGNERHLLVMLRMPAPHFRPDLAYAGSYDPRAGREARRRIAEAIAQQHDLRIVNEWPMPALGVDCFVMEAGSATSLASVVEQLERDPRVESAQSMNVLHTLAHSDPLYPLQPGAREWHLEELHRVATGKHVRIAEIDTGVELDHPDLVGQLIEARNFVDDRAPIGELHGTAVAGIIVARPDNGVGVAGIAPDATLLALRACWQREPQMQAAMCSSFTVAKALQFALESRVQVINLSIGGPPDRLLARLIDVALARGITVVGAVDPTARDGGFPASHRGVLAIDGEDGQHPPIDLLAAPARDIPTSITGHRWGFVSGSSFAAAHVTGLVALLRELDPNLQAQPLRAALAAQSSHGAAVLVDACNAVARAAHSCACSCSFAQNPTPGAL